jgi:hypothetical protein
LLDVEHETFGTFPNGFGDNGGPEGSDEQDRDDTGYGTADDAIRTIDGVPVDECHGQYPPPISSIASNGHLGQITDPPPQNIPANSDASMFKYSDTIDLDFQSFGPPLSHGLSMVASEMPAEGYDIVSQPNQGNFNGTNGIDLQVPNLEHFPSIGLHNAVYEPFHQLQDPSLEHDTQIYQQAFPT